MSDPVQLHELSGLLDGELDPRRAEEVRQALAADPALRAEYERLLTDDRLWTQSALRAEFTPDIQLHPSAQPLRPPFPFILLALFATLLLAVRFLTKLDLSPILQIAPHALLLALVLAALIHLNRTLAAESPQSARSPA